MKLEHLGRDLDFDVLGRGAFDFFWSLHIMDYRERESFNHPLLVGFAALGVITVLSGALLWAARLRRSWRRR